MKHCSTGSGPDLPEASEARNDNLTEEQRAASFREAGLAVVVHRGRHWFAPRPGFYEPLHWLARFAAGEAVRPAIRCWGYRATIRDEDSQHANAVLPVHLLADPALFDVGSLSSRRRTYLRKAQRDGRFVVLPDPSLLRAEGHDLYVGHLERTRHKRAPTLEEYLGSVDRLFTLGRPTVLAAVVGGRLAGYLHGTAVDGVAYIDDVVLGNDYLDAQIGTGLHFEFITAAGRTPGIHTVVHGLHAREDPGLDRFKEGFGFTVVRVPARTSLPMPVDWYLRRRRPDVYYRLTGR